MTEALDFLVRRGFNADNRRGNGWARRMVHNYRLRDEHIARFGFAVLDEATIAAISSYSPLLEVGAGSGYWAYELTKAGIDIVATDPGTGRYSGLEALRDSTWVPWCEIIRCTGVTAVRRFPGRALLMVWPDMADWPVRTLRAYGGRTVLYVGEGAGGATANDAFHDYLAKRFRLVKEVPIPQFWVLHDRLCIFDRVSHGGRDGGR